MSCYSFFYLAQQPVPSKRGPHREEGCENIEFIALPATLANVRETICVAAKLGCTVEYACLGGHIRFTTSINVWIIGPNGEEEL